MCSHCMNRYYRKGEAFALRIMSIGFRTMAVMLINFNPLANASPLLSVNHTSPSRIGEEAGRLVAGRTTGDEGEGVSVCP